MTAAVIARHVLIKVFDGDVHKWIAFLRQTNPRQRKDDMPFALAFKEKIEADPCYIDKVRKQVEDES